MAEYIDRTIIPYAKLSEFDKGSLVTRDMIECMPTADVIERSEYDRVVESFKAMVEIKNEDLIAMRDKYYTLEKEYAELKVNIDKSIEEMRFYEHRNVNMFTCGLNKAIEILKRNIGE